MKMFGKFFYLTPNGYLSDNDTHDIHYGNMAKRYRRRRTRRKTYKRRRTTKRYGKFWKINKPYRNRRNKSRHLNSKPALVQRAPIGMLDRIYNAGFNAATNAMDNLRSWSWGDYAKYGTLATGGAIAANTAYNLGKSAYRLASNPHVRQAYIGRDRRPLYERTVENALNHQQRLNDLFGPRLPLVADPDVNTLSEIATGAKELAQDLKKSRKQSYPGQDKFAAAHQASGKVMKGAHKATEAMKKGQKPLTRAQIRKAREQQLNDFFNPQ